MSDDLRALLQSPELTLEPPRTLADDVRRHARRRRRSTRISTALTAVVLLGGSALVAPHVASSIDDLRTRTNEASQRQPDPRAPHATSEVLTLHDANRAQLITWFEGSVWCTKTTRITVQSTCAGPVDPAHQGFSYVIPVGSPAVTIDDQHYVAGVAPPGAARIVVHMSDGREFDTEIVSGLHFPVRVWSSVAINLSYGHVAYYLAYDTTGREIARKAALRQASPRSSSE